MDGKSIMPILLLFVKESMEKIVKHSIGGSCCPLTGRQRKQTIKQGYAGENGGFGTALDISLHLGLFKTFF